MFSFVRFFLIVVGDIVVVYLDFIDCFGWVFGIGVGIDDLNNG